MSGLLGGFSPHLPWSRRRWWAARLILGALTGLSVAVTVLVGLWWIGLPAGAFVALWVGASFYGERLDCGPRRTGGAS